MPGVDWIPLVAHMKAAIQKATGDTEGAKQTAENFFQECPGVSQLHSVIQLAKGDKEGALETQKRCVGTINNVLNGLPLIGHIKGAVHHAVGDHEGGNKALNAATRTTVVVASGAAAGIATGGLGAVSAGIAAGAGYDVVATKVSGKDQGSVAAFNNAVENPSAGAFFDAVAIPVCDGVVGYSGGQAANELARKQLFVSHRNFVGPLNDSFLFRYLHFLWFEDALDDSYMDVTEIKLNFLDKEHILKTYATKKAEQKFKGIFTTVAALSILLRLIKEDSNRDPNDPRGTLERRETELIRPSWLPLYMPPEFSFTAAVQLNNDGQGLYHSFIRHMTDWQDFISFGQPLIDRLSPLTTELNDVESANSSTPEVAQTLTAIALNNLDRAWRGLEDEDVTNLRTAFVEIQLLMHRFIQENLTNANYIRSTVNDAGEVRLHFRVYPLTGAPRQMVVCLSNNIYCSRFNPKFHNDKRPLKTVTTVFFI